MTKDHCITSHFCYLIFLKKSSLYNLVLFFPALQYLNFKMHQRHAADQPDKQPIWCNKVANRFINPLQCMFWMLSEHMCVVCVCVCKHKSVPSCTRQIAGTGWLLAASSAVPGRELPSSRGFTADAGATSISSIAHRCCLNVAANDTAISARFMPHSQSRKFLKWHN